MLNRRFKYLPILFLCVLGFLIYSNTFHASFHFDDEGSILSNSAIRNLWNLKAIWDFGPTRFFTHLSLAVNYHLHRLSLPGYHMFNLAVHLGAAILVSWFILLILSTPYFTFFPRCGLDKSSPYTTNVGVQFIEPEGRVRNLIALFGGLLFVSHPIQTQAVTYIIQRAASLATFFYLLSLCLYLKARLMQTSSSNVIPADSKRVSNNVARGFSLANSDPERVALRKRGFPTPVYYTRGQAKTFGNDSVSDSRGWLKFYAGSILAAVAAFFTKEIAVTLPFMLLLIEVSFFRDTPHPYPPPPAYAKATAGRRGGRRGGGEIKRLAPFFLILLILLITIKVTGSIPFSEMRILRESQSGLTAITPTQYLFTQFRVIVTYLRLLLVPVNQNLDYDYPISQTLWQAPTLISLVFLLVLLIAGFLLFRKHRLISFSIFWFFLALASDSSIILRRDVIFEHRLYLPMVGYSLFLPVAAYGLFGNKRLKPMIIILLAIIACYSVMTYSRNRIWKDELTLWNDVVQKSPNKMRPYNNRGLALANKGEYDQAIADYNQVLRIEPGQVLRIEPEVALAYNNLGFIYEKRGDYGNAAANYNQAIQVNPNYAKAYYNRGNLSLRKGDYDRAIADFEQSLRKNPGYTEAYNNCGIAYLLKGDNNQAIANFTQVLQINPNTAGTYYNRSVAYARAGKYENAREDLQKAKNLGFTQ